MKLMSRPVLVGMLWHMCMERVCLHLTLEATAHPQTSLQVNVVNFELREESRPVILRKKQWWKVTKSGSFCDSSRYPSLCKPQELQQVLMYVGIPTTIAATRQHFGTGKLFVCNTCKELWVWHSKEAFDGASYNTNKDTKCTKISSQTSRLVSLIKFPVLFSTLPI